jgi:hypothetical protein
MEGQKAKIMKSAKFILEIYKAWRKQEEAGEI